MLSKLAVASHFPSLEKRVANIGPLKGSTILSAGDSPTDHRNTYFMQATFEIQLGRIRVDTQSSIVTSHRQKCPVAIPVQGREVCVNFRGRTIYCLVGLDAFGFDGA